MDWLLERSWASWMFSCWKAQPSLWIGSATINGMIDQNQELLLSTALQNNRAKYQSDLWRGCSELCLSPQARAKIGRNGSTESRRRTKDPLLAVLTG